MLTSRKILLQLHLMQLSLFVLFLKVHERELTLLDEASDDDIDNDSDADEEEVETMEREVKRARVEIPREIATVKRKLDFDDLSHF